MKNKMIYGLLAVSAFTSLCQQAKASDNYYEIMSAQAPIPEKVDNMPVQKVLTFPVVVERTSMTTGVVGGKATPVMLEETTALPIVLEKTSVAKPHHWPLSFGVWP